MLDNVSHLGAPVPEHGQSFGGKLAMPLALESESQSYDNVRRRLTMKPFALARPVRLAGLLFGGLFAVFAICAMFIDKVNPVAFVLGGAAYILLLSLFSVGLGLALPSRLASWWLLSGVLPLLANASFWLAVRADPEFFFRAYAAVIPGLLCIQGSWILAGCAVAGWGWVRYVRWRMSTSADDRGRDESSS
jgi:hypothetical protein